MAKLELKAGDRIVFGRCKKNRALQDAWSITIGRVYTLVQGHSDIYFIDDAQELRYPCEKDYSGRATKIIE